MTSVPIDPLLDATAIIGNDLDQNLPNAVREVLLNVILAWANLDMATAFFVASVSGLDPDEGAEIFGRKEIADKLKRAAKVLEARDVHVAAKKIREIAEAYPEKALFRRRIAHSKCAGVRKSLPSRVVFLPFEREGPPGNLAVEVFHVSKFTDATAWAVEIHDYLMAHIDEADFFQHR